MKRLLPIALLAGCLAVGCDKSSSNAVPNTEQQAGAAATEPTPQPLQQPAEVVSAYYSALWDMDLQNAYQLVSNADRAARPLDDFQRNAAKSNERFASVKRSFAVHDTTVDGATARVSVDITGPDLPKMQQAMLAEYTKAGRQPDAAALKTELDARLASGEYPRATRRHEVVLVQEDGVWRLDFDWDTDRPGRVLPERVPSAKTDAGSKD